jgi:tetratricopeptide (TPR) repeat protein
MGKKNPSSLDYEALLHELALNNWRRSILEGDFPRAIQNAAQLTQSRDRFWRWQGYLDMALTYLCQGRTESFREALEPAKDCFRDVSGLRVPAFEIETHFWLETGKPRRALDAAREAGSETPLLTYLRGLAHARLGDLDSAASCASALWRRGSGLETALSRHVTAESHPEDAVATLSRAASSLLQGERDPASAGTLVKFAFGSVLFQQGEMERAREEFDYLLMGHETLLYWPVPFVRALFYRARIRLRLGDELGASADAERLLSYWGAGDLDREPLEEARQLVKA